ncbi:hypothetical protein ABZ079_33415 [Streptomyces sp. NPDC006314]|uniref:hypothetical protein n=1 Tax=Streptomyces sp. NPDC006314 TaxID=3154475 RepID=UPI0033B7353D
MASPTEDNGGRPGPGRRCGKLGAGTYRLFLDFQHNDTVRTAAFTVQADKTAGTPKPADGEEHGNHQR